MKTKNLYSTGVILAFTLLLMSCKREHFPGDCRNGGVPTVKIFATGLNSPRGLKFGPDGNLYVAEAGLGGTNSTVGQCTQVAFPLGPIFGSTTSGRISKINHSGERTTVTDQLPSSILQPTGGADIQGVADIEFIGNKMYALLAGAGCSHGVPSIPNAVIRVNRDGSWSILANLSEYTMTHETLHPEPHAGAEPDGTPYSMINVHGDLYVIEPNHGDYIKVTQGGATSRFVDISATQDHIVPTVQAYYHGNFFVGNLDTFPAPPGASKILKITPDGQVSDLLTGFNMVLGVAFDQFGRLYVLESTTNNPFPTPGTGDIVRIDHTGKREIIVTGLSLPTGMTFGPDGKLYVSNMGYGPGSTGGGQILQVDLEHCKTPDPVVNTKDL